MRKLALNPEDLIVESFATESLGRLRGTVLGAELETNETCSPSQCAPCWQGGTGMDTCGPDCTWQGACGPDGGNGGWGGTWAGAASCPSGCNTQCNQNTCAAQGCLATAGAEVCV
jgi:hypothetical protein